MRALTLWQPWASIVAAGDKLVENRPLPLPPALKGQRIAIHAGLKYDDSAVPFIAARLMRPVPRRGDVPYGAIIGVATFVDCAVKGLLDENDKIPRGHWQWFTGPYGYVLADVVAIEPIPCRGFQGFWTIPPVLLDHIPEHAR